MAQLQLFFEKTIDHKTKIKATKVQIREAIETDGRCQKAKQELDTARQLYKDAVNVVMDQFVSELDEMEELRNEIRNDEMVMTDQVVVMLTKNQLYKDGQIIAVTDKNGRAYIPDIKVKFKREPERDEIAAPNRKRPGRPYIKN